ncbi:unnamed protein product [Adineta steineri]|uniref:Uncharacterized protein n=1 Tax=Adineta steineri TaxID=433720 RepID=A0A814AWX8_9BILA|nr:unnamed protein product [Adineta steineri]CAF0918308.1 unnamed protein product [Adineta steineri]
MSSATYLLTDTNETISWTYDRFLSNASIEKKDLSLFGFITGILCIIGIVCSLIFRIIIHFHGKISLSTEKSSHSPLISSITLTTTTTTDDSRSEF